MFVLHSALETKLSRKQMKPVSIFPLFPKRLGWACELDGQYWKEEDFTLLELGAEWAIMELVKDHD